ncbi:hypothetical protein FGF1_29230 [Flavobacteriaceae bacterium GF1]
MKHLVSHTILSIIALAATNVYFVLALLINPQIEQQHIAHTLSFYEFMGIANGALLIISIASITYKELGDRMLSWGYSNAFRLFWLILLSVTIFVMACMGLFALHYVIYDTLDIPRAIYNSLGNTYFISLVFYFALVSVLMFFISNLERRSGSIQRLLSQSMGEIIKPKLVQRGFMFIDLNEATTIAERLGSEKYANLLRDCFRLLNELVAFTPFEIYQYVGDEAVITWKESTPNADLTALHLFFDFKAYLQENELAFASAYQLQPKFKCAVHSGQVVQSEIGREVKHLVYHGDVLNTAARLLSQCHRYQTDFIISEHAIKNRERISQVFDLQPVTYNNLKGKENSVNAYVTTEKIKNRYPLNTKKIPFLETMVTDSHLLKFNFKAMKTIKNAMLSILMGTFLIACGGKGQQDPETKEQEQLSTVASQSAVQVIRRSDLKLQTIKNGTVTSYMPITGRVIPKYTTQLVAEVQGRILPSNKPFKEGTTYKKGEAMLRIDSQEFALNLESQKSAFLNILTDMMPDLKADYPENYQNWLAYVNNYQSGISLPTLPGTKSNPEKYFLTSRQVYNTYFNIKAQEERLKKFTLTAPYTGSLSAAVVDNGGLVSPGQPLGTYISDNNYEVEAAVKLGLAQVLKVGQKIELHNKGLNKTFIATVVRINNIVDPNTQNIPVFLQVSDRNLRSGMYLEGQVTSSTFENAVKIPATAINRDNTVHLLRDGVIRKETIEIMNSEISEAVVAGLKDNAQLILTTFQNPVSGLKISE